MFIKYVFPVLVIVFLTQCNQLCVSKLNPYSKVQSAKFKTNVPNRIFYKNTHLLYIDSIRTTIVENNMKYRDMETYIIMDSLYNKIKTNRKRNYIVNVPSLLNVNLKTWEQETDIEIDVTDYVKQINHIRNLHKLSPVKRSSVLDEYAKKHCQTMVEKVDIYHSEYESDLGYDYMETVAGINNYCRIFAWGPINAYYDSPEHKAIMLNKYVKYIGIYSYVKEDYEYNVIIWITDSIVSINLTHKKTAIQNK